MRRVVSPSGAASTLMTSAPRSASSRPALGPMMVWQNSSTRMPASGSGSWRAELTSGLRRDGNALAQPFQASALHHRAGQRMSDHLLGEAGAFDQRLKVDAGLDADLVAQEHEI